MNTSKLTLPVIGSCKTQFIPPVIILQSWKIVPFTARHIWTLYKPAHTQNLGIPAGLDNSENITPQHPQQLFRLGSICMVLDCCTQLLLELDFNKCYTATITSATCYSLTDWTYTCSGCTTHKPT